MKFVVRVCDICGQRGDDVGSIAVREGGVVYTRVEVCYFGKCLGAQLWATWRAVQAAKGKQTAHDVIKARRELP